MERTLRADRQPEWVTDGRSYAGHDGRGAEGGADGVYLDRRGRFEEQHRRIDQRWNRVANARLLLFLVGAAVLGLGIWLEQVVLVAAVIPCVAAFLAAIAYHTRLGETRRTVAELRTINDEGLSRLRRDWNALPLRTVQPEETVDAVASDLDLLGHASLQHLLGTPATAVGQAALRRWLLQPAEPEVVRERQAAVIELRHMLDFRDELALRGRLMGDVQPQYERFIRWAESEAWLAPRPGLLWAVRLLTLAIGAAVAAQVAGLVAYPLWLAGLLGSYGLILTVGKRVDLEIEQVAERQVVFRTYAALFALIRSQQFSAPLLQRLQTALSAEHLPADRQMTRLGRIMILADLRLWLLYFPLKLFTLWNFHVLWLLERWKREAGSDVQVWLDVLGDLEALAALATLAHDHPHWSFPELVEGKRPALLASNLGHPLLPPEKCVGNDVAVGPPGTFLLVTGSNMSGKSTLLRAIGLNAALAQAGGPVCASAMCLPPLVLATSMRVQDSLELGVSYFMAELRRLKHVVDTAAQVHEGGSRTLLFLLDEILHGTNTHERQIAVRRIVRHLMREGAIGAISTHDLSLTKTPEVAAAGRPVYFTEQFLQGAEGPEMHFDYVLRAGVAPSTNALRLMELVGLTLDEAEEVAPERDPPVLDAASGTGTMPPERGTSGGVREKGKRSGGDSGC